MFDEIKDIVIVHDKEPFTNTLIVSEGAGLPNESVRFGYVYVYEFSNGLKIGRSKNPKKRLNALKTQSGRKFIKAWVSIECANYKEMEVCAHRALKEFRTIGEWFSIDFLSALKVISVLPFENITEQHQYEYDMRIHKFTETAESFFKDAIESVGSTRKYIETLETENNVLKELTMSLLEDVGFYTSLIGQDMPYQKRKAVLMDRATQKLTVNVTHLLDSGSTNITAQP